MLDRVRTCNNCGAVDSVVLYAEGIAQKHRIVRCANCGLMYASPTDVNLAQYAVADGEPMTLQTPSVVRSFDKLPDYEPIGEALRALMPQAGTLLEIGCHAGVLLDRFRRQGWTVSGVEPDPRAAAFARTHYGLDVVPCTLEEAGFAPARFDAAVMLHVIEHLDDPAGTLRSIAQVLRPGGLLVVETPTYDTWMYQLLGRHERSLSCDGHVYFFTARTLGSLLERSGFGIVRQWRVGRTVSLGRLLWNVGVMSKNAALQRWIEKLNAAQDLARRGKLYINARDMLRVFARRM